MKSQSLPSAIGSFLAMIMFFVLTSSVEAAPPNAPKEWARWNQVTVGVKGDSGMKAWTLSITPSEMRIDTQRGTADDEKPTSLILTRNRFFATIGIDSTHGHEMEALELPMVMYQLVTKILSLALPSGPLSVTGSQRISIEETIKDLAVSIPSAGGIFGKPWRVSGQVDSSGEHPVSYSFSLDFTVPGKADLSESMEFEGLWNHISPLPDFPDTLSLEGWKTFVIERVKVQQGTTVAFDFRARELQPCSNLGQFRTFSEDYK